MATAFGSQRVRHNLEPNETIKCPSGLRDTIEHCFHTSYTTGHWLMKTLPIGGIHLPVTYEKKAKQVSLAFGPYIRISINFNMLKF